MSNQKCSRCLTTKPLTREFFYISKSHKNGFKGVCITCRKETMNKYMQTDKGKATFKRRADKVANSLELRRKYRKYKSTRAYKEKSRIYANKKGKEDLNFKLTNRLRMRFKYAIIENVTFKDKESLGILGCTPQDARFHLEQQFKEDMSWDNYGEWQIDHINPCYNFDLTDFEQQKKCFHFSNIQPLWKMENLLKGSKSVC